MSSKLARFIPADPSVHYTDSIIFGTGAGGSSRVTLSILWNQTLETQYIKNIKITKNIERRLFTITTRITFSES